MSNPPINAVGNELLITVNPGIYTESAPITLNLPNPATLAVGTSLTILINASGIINYDTIDPRSVIVTCPLGTSFSDGSRTYTMHKDGASFTITVADATTWSTGFTVIHGANNIHNEDIVAYSAYISSFIVSSYTTKGDIYVLGSTIFHGYVYGLNASPPIYALSTNYLSTGTLTTGSLLINNLSSIFTQAITFNVGSNFARINRNTDTISTNYIHGSTMNLSSLNFIDTKYGTSNVYLSSVNSALQIGNGVFSSIYVTYEQSQFSNISTQMYPTMLGTTSGPVTSTLSTSLASGIENTYFGPGMSSYVIYMNNKFASLTTNPGISILSNAFRVQISTVTGSPGLSTMSTNFGNSIITNAVPGASNLSTIMWYTFSSLSIEPGLSTISSIIGPGLSSIGGELPISTFSTSVSLGFSTIAAFIGYSVVSTVISKGASSIAMAIPGFSNISTVFSYGISSITTGPGVSSFSTVMQLGISSFKSGAVLSSLSTIISLGISSINYAPGVSSLSTAISLGLSSIVDYGYIPFQTIDVPNAIANNYTPKTVSSLLALLSTSFSTMNDIQGVSSVSSLLAYGVSSISGGPGLSTLSTTISMGLSSITVKMIFPTVWSSQSTFVGTGLTLQDISINPSQPLNVTVGATLQLNGNPYPQALSYINSSTISTSVMQIKGSLYVSSITASSIQISSLFQTNSISTSYLRASTLSFSETFFTDTQYLYSYNASLYLNGASLYNSTDGISSLSSVVGYGAQSIVGLGISSMSTTISYGLSTVNVVPGLSSLYSTLFSYYYPNFSSLSTLNAFTNNVTLYSVTAGFLSTNLISTINYSSLNVYTSSLNVGSAYISSLSTPSIFATNFSGDTIFASTFYTSTLTASTIYISSFYIQVANFSTVSVATMYVSSMKFPGNSTLWASSGSLMLNSFKLPTDPYPGLNPTYSNFSIPVTYLSTLYAQNVFVTTPSISTFASSNTVVNGFVSSGIFSTTIQKVIVRNNNTWQSWNLAGVGIFDSNIANTTTSLSSLYIGYDPQSYSRSNFTDTNYRNPVGLGFSTLNTATIWDGYKLITCGNETTTPVQSGIYVYIPPLYWNNMHPSNVTTNPYAWNKITASIGTAGYPGGPGSGNIGSNIGDIEFNGSMYVIVLNLNTADDHGYVRWSLDGINYYPNFNSISLSPSYANPLSLMKSVAWNGSYWIMGWSGNTNIDTASLIQLSKDGKNWATSNNNFNTNYNGTGLNYPGHVTKIVWNGTVWTAAWAYDSNAGTYPAIVSNLRYSYDGINWSNCVWGGNSFSGSWASGKGYFTELIVTQNFVEASYFSGNYGSPGVTTNNTYRSYDGINFTTNADPGFPNYGWMAPYYDGNKLGHSLIAGMIPNTSPYWGISTNIYTSLLTNSTFTNLAFQNQMLTDTQGIPAVKRVAVRSNVIPSLSMSNLNIYGSTFHNVYDPVNTIVGFANTAIFPGGTIDWLERQNYLKFNNTLNIVSYVSTQVIIDTPGNPNTTYRNVNNFGRATLDVLCTVNAQNFWARNLNLSPSQLWTTSTFGSNQYAFYSPYSTFAQTLALGSSSNILNILSTPLFTLDIYHNKNYSIIREPTFTPLNSIAASNAIKYLLPQDNTALYPLVSGSDGTLSYFWRGQNATYYKFIDSPGTTYFTGQHPTNCLDINTETASNYIGQIVSIAGQGYTAYDLSGNQVTGKSAILITNATPITKLTTRDMDPTVFGVVTDRFNGSIDASGNFATYTNSGFETQLFGRIMVNSLGEGAIWVTNYNGNISNGDYICSSPIPGLSRKQDNNRLWNYTIAKATQSCDFNPQFISTMTLSTYGDMTISTFVSCMSYKCEPIEFNGSTFMKAFIGCTYHCA